MQLLISLILVVISILGCKGEVRYDAAASPIDTNYHTVLLESDCDGSLRRGFGQIGCSWGADEPVSGKLTVYTPLPGKISMYSRACGIDHTEFHSQSGGAFRYDLSELLPAKFPTCIIDVFVSWQLPADMTSEYPLRGMSGKIYLRRRAAGTSQVSLQFAKDVERKGVSWAQFREVAKEIQESRVAEPLELKMLATKPVDNGAYRLFGCGQGVASSALNGDTAIIQRDELLGPSPKKSSCVLFGFMLGKTATGETVNDDAMVGVEVFNVTNQKLAVNLWIDQGRVCYEAESSVSLAVLNHDGGTQFSNKLDDCLYLPVSANSITRLGFFTAQGRAYYATIQNNQITEVFQ